MAAYTALDPQSIVVAGLALLRRDGVDAVSLRAVAGELGVTPMALYRHVGDAAALRQRIVLAALADLPHLDGRGAWEGQYRRWAHRARSFLLPQPGLARHVLLHWTELPPALAVVEDLLAAVAGTSTPASDSVAASNAVFTYVLLRVDAEQAFVRGNHLHRTLEHLDDGDLPLLRANAEEYAVARLDEHFAYGLDALLAGLASARRRPRRGGTGTRAPRP